MNGRTVHESAISAVTIIADGLCTLSLSRQTANEVEQPDYERGYFVPPYQ